MSIFIDAFFVAAPLATLYVFTSFLSGTVRIIAFAAIVLLYGTIVYYIRGKVRTLLETFLTECISKLDRKKMLLIITITAVVTKAFFTIFFKFDSTIDGDVKIYSDLADQIIATGNLHTYAISHLYGVALHFVLFKMAHLPLHIGMFTVIFIGTVVNFLSFSEMIGKEKAFLLVMIYLLMPSTSLLSFCMTHEIFAYLYVSIFLYSFNRYIKQNDRIKAATNWVIMILSTILMCFVNPGGYIIYIIIVLAVLFSNLPWKKKGMIAAALLLSILGSQALSAFLQVYEYRTALNTYTILIHGSNPWSLGEQVDGYPLEQMRKYIFENTLDFSHEGFLDAARNVLFWQYKYLLTHPIVLLKLIIHKTYILWSGMHYPIELCHYYGSIGGVLYYAVLAVNTLIFLFVLTVGLVYRKEASDEITVSNYKLEFLGVFALTMFCIVANKYSLYVTLFLYFIAFYRAEIRCDE